MFQKFIAALLATLSLTSQLNGIEIQPPWPRMTGATSAHNVYLDQSTTVIIAAIDPYKGGFQYLCAGVLTNESTIITAAHGIRNINIGRLLVLRLTEGNGSPEWETSMVKSMLVSESLKKKDAWHDLAVLKLLNNFPLKTSTPEIESERPGETYRLIGWSELNGVPHLHQLELEKAIYQEVVDFDELNFAINREGYLILKPKAIGSRVSKGNSGAPVYALGEDGKSHLVGIISYEYTNRDSPETCFVIVTKFPDLTELYDSLASEASFPSGFRTEEWQLLEGELPIINQSSNGSHLEVPISANSVIPIENTGNYSFKFSDLPVADERHGLSSIHFLLSPGNIRKISISLKLGNQQIEKYSPDLFAYTLKDHEWIGRAERRGERLTLTIPSSIRDFALITVQVRIPHELAGEHASIQIQVTDKEST